MKSDDQNRKAIVASLWAERALLVIAAITITQWIVQYATTGHTSFTAATYVIISLVLVGRSIRRGRVSPFTLSGVTATGKGWR